MPPKIEKKIVAGEEVYTYGADVLPPGAHAMLENSIDKVSREIGGHVQGIVDMVSGHIPGLNQAVVLLCSPDGRVASVVGSLPLAEQLEALENAIVLTKRIISGTSN